MNDQVNSLKKRNLDAFAYHSNLSDKERQNIKIEINKSKQAFLYVTPEQLVNDTNDFGHLSNIKLIVIDEAHCISSWGHDFRPAYRKMGNLKRFKAPICACTATATPSVREDIIKNLNLVNPKSVILSFDRKNIKFIVRLKDFTQDQFAENLKKQSLEDCGIIYCFEKNTCDELSQLLRRRGFKAGSYHSGIKSDKREKTQESWMKGDLKILVATIAFGMGIDKTDVRWVIHYDLPKTIEGYYQEAGRAGRDGLFSESILYFSPDNASRLKWIIEKQGQQTRGRPNMEKKVNSEIRSLEKVVEYCTIKKCRRITLLKHFGETAEIKKVIPVNRYLIFG
eukprot:GHVL01027676.1.p1 GENE.GHVL01027676.1~~GHVL01027676.1.p1  ORF type:complete len:338 (-),score=62.12 GHVL01027676.1:3-1016(-)